MPRECKCSGACAVGVERVTRRDFIALLGAGAIAGAPSWGDWVQQQMPAEKLAAWKAELLKPQPPRVYRSDRHTDARMHLGGIGTGNVEIGADGQWTTWQLFNTLIDGQVPFHFAVRAGGRSRLLQTAGGPDAPRVRSIEMVGEYPFATLRFVDDELPVDLRMTAFTPFAPLDTRLSSMPAACVVFTIHNPTGQRQSVSLASMIVNPVGYDARGAIDGVRHPNLGYNVCIPFAGSKLAGFELAARTAAYAPLPSPLRVRTNQNVRELHAPPSDAPAELTIEALGAESRDGDLIWLEDAGQEMTVEAWRSIRDAVAKGATLALAGAHQPLLRDYARLSGGRPIESGSGRPDITFEDFEKGYDNWTAEGEAFGSGPAHGTLPGQQPVSGFVGKGLVNSFLGGDGPVGTLTSKEFTVQRSYIRLLVGGGSHPDTQVRLMVDGKVVRAASGKDREQLEPVVWDVRDLEGKTARIVIVDGNSGGWGHINVDQIEFVDFFAPREVLALLDELLPARMSDVRRAEGGAVEFVGLAPREGSQTGRLRSGVRTIGWKFGAGRVVLAAGGILDPALVGFSMPRTRAYATLCELAGISVEPPQGQCEGTYGVGTMALATTGPRPSGIAGAADLATVWREFAEKGAFASYSGLKPSEPTAPGASCAAAVASSVTVDPGKTAEVVFFLTWRFPNKYSQAQQPMGCHYATLWPSARAVADELAAGWAGIRKRTEAFRRAAYDTTLPYYLTDCLTSQAATIRHIGVVFRIANGDPYGWEGSNGCCQPTCTHVWGYEQSLSRLFPDLEREMRRIDFMHQQRADGGVNNRTEVPSPPHPTGEQPFADGHASCILKAYREALNNPDEGWLREYWPHIRRAVDYLIGRDAATSGGTPSGTLEDDQWNTYDEALHGVTTFIGAYYLAALRAGEEWAKRVGDAATAARFRAVFEKGRQRLVELCWNGEYFRQNLPGYEKRWGEVGPGCMADQLIGQWWAHQLDLGYLLPEEMVKSALRSIFKYNWMPDLTGWKHVPRAFAGAGDKGLIICTWPKGGRPDGVMLYSDEVWTGIEYQVAAHMIYEGLVEEGLSIVRGARERYDGVPRPPISRNPWNEIECGGHYARAMSSWSLLLALSGWRQDALARVVRVAPAVTPGAFRSLFVAAEGWGSLHQRRTARTQTNDLRVVEGRLDVARLDLRLAGSEVRDRVRATCRGRSIGATLARSGADAVVTFREEVALAAGDTLTVVVG